MTQPVPVPAADARLVGEVRRLDDQRVAFPVPARVAQVLTQALAEMRTPVERNDARVVNHLVGEDEGVGRLQDPIAVAVRNRHHAADDAARDAPIVEREVLGAVEGTVPEAAAIPGRRPLQRLRRDRRHPAVRRIDDERGLPEGLGAAPESITAAGLHAGRGHGVLDRLLVPLDSIGELLIGQLRPAGKLRGAFPRDATGAVAGPLALEIRVAPRRPGRRPFRRGGGFGFGCRRGSLRGGRRGPRQDHGRRTIADSARTRVIGASITFVSWRIGELVNPFTGSPTHQPTNSTP